LSSIYTVILDERVTRVLQVSQIRALYGRLYFPLPITKQFSVSEVYLKFHDKLNTQGHLLYTTTLQKHHKLLTNKLRIQDYNESRLKTLFLNFYGYYNDLVCDYKLSKAHILHEMAKIPKSDQSQNTHRKYKSEK
jgi:hypothetical protein